MHEAARVGCMAQRAEAEISCITLHLAQTPPTLPNESKRLGTILKKKKKCN